MLSEAIAYGVAAGVTIYQGSMVALDDGFAGPAIEGEGLASVGVAFTTVNNSEGADGDVSIDCRRGIYHFDNNAAAPLTISDIGNDCFMVSDHEVSGDGTGRSVAGEVINVDAGGVFFYRFRFVEAALIRAIEIYGYRTPEFYEEFLTQAEASNAFASFTDS